MSEFSIRVESSELIFSAAHFITFDGGCEALHGHDYRVKVEIFGPIGANEYVVDFVLIRDCLKTIVQELDHRVLLPGKHDSITVTQEGQEVVVRLAGRRWIFPADNCRILPIGNTTTERFAEHIGRQLAEWLVQKRQPVARLSVEVSECDGFAAVWRMELGK